MEIRLTLFLAFVSVTMVTNALMIWIAYRAFAHGVTGLVKNIKQIETGDAKAGIQAMATLAEQMAKATESAKQKFVGYEPKLATTHRRLENALVDANQKLERAAEEISNKTQTVGDSVAIKAY